jgi:hypothetical protein
MKLTLKSLSIVVLLTSVTNVFPQDPILKGKVIFDDPQERGSQIMISVRNLRTGQLVGGQQDKTKGGDWYHVAPLNALVDIEFDGGGCYEGDGHPKIPVKQENEELPEVVLKKTRLCRLKELRQRRGKTTTNVKTNERANKSRSAADDEEPQAVVNFTELHFDKATESSLIPSSNEFKRELEAEAVHARNGEFFDTFQYTFALKSALYGDRPELMKVLSDFKANTENSVLFEAIGQVRPEMFADIVRLELQPSDDVNTDNVFAVVQEESVSPNIRGTANVALLNRTLPDEKLQALNQFYRRQSPDSEIFETSLVGRLRIGEAEDIAQVVSYIKDQSIETSRMAMEAVSLATLINGKDAFPEASTTLANVATNNKNPWLRGVAYRSLRPFVDQGDETAFKAMKVGSRDPNPYVRVQVALALGVGDTEKDKKASYLLRYVLLNDKDRYVRDAARLSLKGALTKGWVAMELTEATAATAFRSN